MPVTGDRNDDRGGDAPAEPAWHERTSTLVGASAAALVVMALLYFIISTLVREFNDPEPTPQYFLDPGGTSSSYSSTGLSTTTTPTITSTSPPVTSDINPGDTTTSGTDTSSSESTSRRPPRTRDDEPRTTRSRPRLNETRTLYPQP